MDTPMAKAGCKYRDKARKYEDRCRQLDDALETLIGSIESGYIPGPATYKHLKDLLEAGADAYAPAKSHPPKMICARLDLLEQIVEKASALRGHREQADVSAVMETLDELLQAVEGLEVKPKALGDTKGSSDWMAAHILSQISEDQGFIYVDPKGDPSLLKKLAARAEALGRADDFICINPFTPTPAQALRLGSSRFESAFASKEGEMSPVEAARALAEAIHEVLGGDSGQPHLDPAVRLLTHYFADTCHDRLIHTDAQEYERLLDACKAEMSTPAELTVGQFYLVMLPGPDKNKIAELIGVDAAQNCTLKFSCGREIHLCAVWLRDAKHLTATEEPDVPTKN